MSTRESHQAATLRWQRRRSLMFRSFILIMTLVAIGIYAEFLLHIRGAAQLQPMEEPVPELAPVPKSTDQPKYDFYTEPPQADAASQKKTNSKKPTKQ